MRPIALLAALFSLASVARAQGLLSRVDPHVIDGNRAYAKGQYDQALRGYEDAERDAPGSPELSFDRGNALYKLGRRDEAREAYLTALGAPDGSFKSQDYYNMGNALWDLDKKDEAAQAFERALLLDPGFDDARHNLALLLTPPPDAGSPDGGQGDGGQGDGGLPDGGQGDGGGGDGGSGGKGSQGGGDGGTPDAGDGGEERPKPAGQDGGEEQNQKAQRPDAGADGQQKKRPEAQATPLDRQQAEQLLDALRQREKNLELWKFRLKEQKAKDVDKDW